MDNINENEVENSTDINVNSKKNSVRIFINNILNFFVFGYWAFQNPLTISPSNFKMLSDLLGLIMRVSKEDIPYMTHIAFVHPIEGEQQIVSIWAGAGMGAEPTKRIAELVEENIKLKAELIKQISENK